MPLSDLQRAILVLLASQRDPGSYVAGAAVLNRDGPRYSVAIDIFHDREEGVAQSADADAAVLTEHGYEVEWVRRQPGIHAAVVRQGSAATRLEWVRDSAYRFFPAIKDHLFGYRLHVADLATNKALAAAGRREPRDILDLPLHPRALPAARRSDPGGGRERPRVFASQPDNRDQAERALPCGRLCGPEPDRTGRRRAVSRALKQLLDEAERFVGSMPATKAGLLFLKDGRPVEPDPETLSEYQEHEGRRGGYWPSSPEIGSAVVRDDGSDLDSRVRVE